MRFKTVNGFCRLSVICFRLAAKAKTGTSIAAIRKMHIFVAVIGMFVLTFTIIGAPVSRLPKVFKVRPNNGDFNQMEIKNEGQQILVR